MKTKLKVFRAMRDLTQEALAKELGVTRQTVIAIEKGKYNPTIELALRLARELGVVVEDLFELDDQETSS